MMGRLRGAQDRAKGVSLPLFVSDGLCFAAPWRPPRSPFCPCCTSRVQSKTQRFQLGRLQAAIYQLAPSCHKSATRARARHLACTPTWNASIHQCQI